MPLLIARPPLALRPVQELSTCSNGTKRREMASALMPMPASSISTVSLQD
jgi:hypothetical protein